MTWHLNGNPAPRHPVSQWLLVDGAQYPSDWPRSDLEALGLTWVEPEPSPPDWPSLALEALTESDLVAIRAIKAGISYPLEWQAYDEALRAIVNGSSGPLPERPEHPE